MRLSTGAFGLDCDLRGGLPSGVVELSGGGASGKTTLGLSILREAQSEGHCTGLIHLDGTPDKEYIQKVGPSDTVVIVPEGGEVAVESAYQLLRRGARAILIDTVTSVEPKGYNPRFGVRRYGDRHRLLYHGLSVLRREAYRRRCTIICLNQIRTDIRNFGFKSPLDSLFEDLCDLRLFLTRRSYETEYGKLANVKVAYRVKKSLSSKKESKGTFTLWPDVGVDRNYELLTYMTRVGILKRSGAYFIPKEGASLGPGYMTASEQVGERYTYYKDMAKTGGNR